ncbi:MAG: SIS domain-containing protein [Oscillospiraceae bacterium]|nr:SIS domain-containing protein [Oscillospiraceae bacterium]
MFKKMKTEKNYRPFYFQDSFHAQCVDVDTLTLIQFDRSYSSIQNILSLPILRKFKHIIVSGCGDSNIATFCLKEAFERYLPDVWFEAVESIELSRHYEFAEDNSDTVAIFVSFSGGVFRTTEALLQCRKHGVFTIAQTSHPDSEMAKEADVLYFTDTPEGDNHAGLRTFYSNIIAGIIFAASVAEIRTGNSYIPELREQVSRYHDAFFKEFEEIDLSCFRTAIHWLDKKYLEVVADGPLFWSGRFVQAKIVELSGDVCSTIDSENFFHVNQFIRPGEDIGEMVILDGNDPNADAITGAVNIMTDQGKEVFLMSDKTPDELGIKGEVAYCHMPFPDREWDFLKVIYGYLPGSIFAGYRHTTLGEPMFRGGQEPDVFIPMYFSPIDVVDR